MSELLLVIGIISALATISFGIYGVTEPGENGRQALFGFIVCYIIAYICLSTSATLQRHENQLLGYQPIEIGRIVKWDDNTTQVITMDAPLPRNPEWRKSR